MDIDNTRAVQQGSDLSIEIMSPADLDAVMGIDRLCFPSPWLADAFITEIGNRSARYLVARLANQIVGYGGAWAISDEAHITTLAVSPRYRRQKVGERLLIALVDEAISRRAHRISLEVREGNYAARRLYQKYGFVDAERSPNYYLDNGEDALIMRVYDIHLPIYRMALNDMRDKLQYE